MNYEPSRILATYLWDQCDEAVQPPTADLTEWPLFYSNLPDKPDNALFLYDSGGIEDGRLMASGEKIFHPTLTLLCRCAKSPSLAFNKIQALALFFDTINRRSAGNPITMESTVYRLDNVSRQSSPLYVGEEAGTNRFMYSLNLKLTLININ